MKMRSLALLALVFVGGCESCKDKPKIDDGVAKPAPTLVPDAAPLNVATVPTAEVERMVNPDHLPAYAGPTGSIEGVVTVTGPAAPDMGLSSATFAACPDAQKEYGKLFREGEPKEPNGERWLADAIVVVTGYSGFWVREKNDGAEATIDGCGYTHRTITMTFGQRLEVLNKTNEFWTPELVPKSPGAIMMAPPHNKDPVKLYPKQAGRHAVVDHDRKYVVNDLMVFRHPLHTVTDVQTGHFRIDGIPVGHVRVTASHPEIPGSAATKEVDIKANEVTTVNLGVSYKGEPAPKDAGPDAWVPYPGLH